MLAVLGVVLIGLGGGGVVRTHVLNLRSARADYLSSAVEYRQLQCVRSLVLDQVQDFETIRIREPDVYWYQRLYELSSPERLVSDQIDWDVVDVILSITESPGLPCDDVGIAVSRQ